MNILIREPAIDDMSAFLFVMRNSVNLHQPWVSPPLTQEEFYPYLARYQVNNSKSYLVIDHDTNDIAGVINLNDIVLGAFQSAYMGYYANSKYAGRGLMSAGLKLVMKKAFTELSLHRIEANIQPDNLPSIRLVSKNGFRKEGYSPRYLKIAGEWKDHERWAITIEDWEKL